MSILIAGGHRRALAGFRFPPCTSATSTRAAQLALLDQLLYAWAETTQMAERLEERTPPVPLPLHGLRRRAARRPRLAGRRLGRSLRRQLRHLCGARRGLRTEPARIEDCADALGKSQSLQDGAESDDQARRMSFDRRSAGRRSGAAMEWLTRSVA